MTVIPLFLTPKSAWDEWQRLQREVRNNPALAIDSDHLNRRLEAQSKAFNLLDRELRHG